MDQHWHHLPPRMPIDVSNSWTIYPLVPDVFYSFIPETMFLAQTVDCFEEAIEGSSDNSPKTLVNLCIFKRMKLTFAVEEYPHGYPRQAAFADSDESFMLYRRFGYVHARLLLHRQDELRELEDELENMDKMDARNEKRKNCLHSRDIDNEQGGEGTPDGKSRGVLLDQIEEKTLKYGTSGLRNQGLGCCNRFH